MAGITWKYHGDKVLDFWVQHKCQEFGYSPKQFAGIYLVEQLPDEPRKQYKAWFDRFDFQTEEDQDWVNFVNGTLNIFYHTSDPTLLDERTWFIDLMQSEAEAREIATSQVYHGTPNLDSFWKVSTNTKPEEVSGRRNGYMFTNELSTLRTSMLHGFYWAVVFQCPDSMRLSYIDGKEKKSLCINWAAEATHMTLCKVLGDGKLKIIPVLVEKRGWKAERMMPNGHVDQTPMSPYALLKYCNQNYYDLYKIWDEIDLKIKTENEGRNYRVNAVATMNDEEIKLRRLIPDIDTFIDKGNVTNRQRELNKEARKARHERNKDREHELMIRVRKMKQALGQQAKRKRNQINPFNLS
jgi:hypothetical protein